MSDIIYPNKDWRKLLADPFSPDELGFKPKGKPYNGKMLAFVYIDSRSVMERLDAVLGSENWGTAFQDCEQGCVRCTITAKIGGGEGNFGNWVEKTDVGTPAGMKDNLDTWVKGAHSDAFKRAAVHFGVGRYLYWMPSTWLPFDEGKKRFTDAGLEMARKNLPKWALPQYFVDGKIVTQSDEESEEEAESNNQPPTSTTQSPAATQKQEPAPKQDTPKGDAPKGNTPAGDTPKGDTAQEQSLALLKKHMSDCDTSAKLQSAWQYTNTQISAGMFTKQQILELNRHKDSVKAKIEAASNK